MTASNAIEKAEGEPLRVAFVIPIRIQNRANMGRPNSMLAGILAKKRDRSEHQSGCLHTRAALARAGRKPYEIVPAVVTLTRVSAGHLDAHDGLPSCLKFVVDGIAEALGIDDGGPFVQWRYSQRKGPPKTHAVQVMIERIRLL